jgi:ATP-binding cassette subfamily C protein CydD
MTPDQNRKSGKRDQNWLRAHSASGRRAAGRLIALGVLNTLLAAAQAYCTAILLAGLLLDGRADTPLMWPAVGFAALAVARAASGMATEGLTFRVGAAIRRKLRTDALTRLLAAGPALLRERHSVALSAIVVDRIESLDGFFARWIPASVVAVVAPLLLILLVVLIDPFAALVFALCGALVPVAMALSGIGAGRAAARQFTAMARLQTRFLDRMRGISTIVLYGRVEDETKALGAAADELRQRTMRVLRVAFLSSGALDCAAATALVILAIRAGSHFAEGRLDSPVNTLFVLLLVPEFFAPLRSFSAAYQDRFQARDAALELEGLPPMPPVTPPLTVRNVQAQGLTVVFDHVGLTWDETRGPVLQDVSFRVAPGETLVVAGPSGAGKSSLIEILLGFVRPTEGQVTFNGADIADLVPQALSRLTAWIGQRPVLFAGTLRENIRFARPEATDDEVNEAARFAKVDSFAADLPEGLDTRLGEAGFGLSGGQAQRIAIARAVLKNAPLLLLDEPTAHLDPATESEVLDSLRRLTLGRTVILVSHSAAAHAWNTAWGGRRIDLRNGRLVQTRGAA